MTPTLPPFPRTSPLPADAPRISVVITNRNYARFLPAAIASVTSQTDARAEVIVVDDGSTDDSRAILAAIGGGVRILHQDHLGQRAAFNAGFAAASGDIVMFLDADDELWPGVLTAVAAAFAAAPATARVIFRLAVIDQDGSPTGAVIPTAGVPLPQGDVRDAVLSRADDLAWPPTSGNAWAAWALRELLPLPLDGDVTGADSALHALVPLLGPVAALEGVGGGYRLHGANTHLRDDLDVTRSRVILRRAQESHRRLDAFARQLGHSGARPRSVTLAGHRLVSLRLGGAGHPVPGDSPRRALGEGLRAAVSRRDAGAPRRIAFAAWLTAMALAPKPLARRIARAGFQSPSAGSPVTRLFRR